MFKQLSMLFSSRSSSETTLTTPGERSIFQQFFLNTTFKDSHIKPSKEAIIIDISDPIEKEEVFWKHIEDVNTVEKSLLFKSQKKTVRAKKHELMKHIIETQPEPGTITNPINRIWMHEKEFLGELQEIGMLIQKKKIRKIFNTKTTAKKGKRQEKLENLIDTSDKIKEILVNIGETIEYVNLRRLDLKKVEGERTVDM